jgi:hypothetical protein
MLNLANFYKLRLNIIDINYKKIKINYNFLNHRYIIYINSDNLYNLKDYLLKKNILSFFLQDFYIKSLFYLPSFSFLRNGNFLCIFIKDTISFINIIKNLNNKQFFYSYYNCFSNLIINTEILKEYEKYNMNYIFIQFILKKIKIKIIILFIFFLISLIKSIK